MSKFKYLSLILTLVLMLPFPQKAKAVNIGPFKVGLQFCEQVDKIGSIVNSFSIVQWPVAGSPGVTMGLLQNTSVILDFCAYLVRLESLDTAGAIFHTANYLNTLTERKWQDHLDQADRTWNLANTLYDFESGQQRKGALESASTYREMNDFVRDSYQWSQKTFNGKDARLLTRPEREREMNQFANVAYQRAILKEAVNCPVPETTNYTKIYNDKIKPWETSKNEAQEDLDFFREKLYSMGPRFVNNQGELNMFLDGIEKLMTQGVTFTKPGTGSVNDESTKKVKGQDGKVKTEKVLIKRNYQIWKTRSYPEMFTAFINKWGPQWSSWVTAQFVQDSYGVLMDPKARVQREFQDLSYECQGRRLMRGYNQDAPDYDKVWEERIEQCKQTKVANQKEAENILNYYVRELEKAISKIKTADAQIWTTESLYLGRSRSVTVSENTAEKYQQQEVKCADNLTPAEMQRISLKQQNVENQYNELIAKEIIKQNIMAEEERRQQLESAQEASKRATFIDGKVRQERDAMSVPQPNAPLRGGM